MKIWDKAGIKLATPGSAFRHIKNCKNYLFAGIQIVSSFALLNYYAVEILMHLTYNFKSVMKTCLKKNVMITQNVIDFSFNDQYMKPVQFA